MVKKSERKENEKSKENGMVEVVFILDRSGSMSGLEEDTIGGFNSMLEKQKAESENIVWSTVLFDHYQEVIHDRVPVSEVEPLTDNEYYVRGTTALLDAVGKAIHHIGMCHKYAKAEDRPVKTMFVITTDGMENASRRYSYRRVKEMIERQKKRYDWEFIFLGANINAEEVGHRMGIDRGRSATFTNDGRGIRQNYETVACVMGKVSRCEDILDEDLDAIRADHRSRKS